MGVYRGMCIYMQMCAYVYACKCIHMWNILHMQHCCCSADNGGFIIFLFLFLSLQRCQSKFHNTCLTTIKSVIILILFFKCSFVLAAAGQSRENWELQRPSTTTAPSSLHAEDGKQSESQTLFSALLNETEVGCSEEDRMCKAFSQISVSS